MNPERVGAGGKAPYSREESASRLIASHNKQSSHGASSSNRAKSTADKSSSRRASDQRADTRSDVRSDVRVQHSSSGYSHIHSQPQRESSSYEERAWSQPASEGRIQKRKDASRSPTIHFDPSKRPKLVVAPALNPQPAAPLCEPGTFLAKKTKALLSPLTTPSQSRPAPSLSLPSTAFTPATASAPLLADERVSAEPSAQLPNATSADAVILSHVKGVTPRPDSGAVRKPPKLPMGFKSPVSQAAVALDSTRGPLEASKPEAEAVVGDSLTSASAPSKAISAQKTFARVELPCVPSVSMDLPPAEVQTLLQGMDAVHCSVESTVVSPSYSAEEADEAAELHAECRAGLRLLGRCVRLLAEGLPLSVRDAVERELAQCAFMAPPAPHTAADPPAAVPSAAVLALSGREAPVVGSTAGGGADGASAQAETSGSSSSPAVASGAGDEGTGGGESPAVSDAQLAGEASGAEASQSDAIPQMVGLTAAMQLATNTVTRAYWLRFLVVRKRFKVIFEQSMRQVSPLLVSWLVDEVANMDISLHGQHQEKKILFLESFLQLYSVIIAQCTRLHVTDCVCSHFAVVE